MSDITLNQATRDVFVQLSAGNAVLMVGPVGVGKTDVARQVFAAMGVQTVIDLRVSQMDPSDMGIPMPDATTGRVRYYLPAWWPTAAMGKVGLLLDELTDGQPAVQAAFNRVLLEREAMDGTKLPSDCLIIATGNRQMDRGNAQRVSRATANRLAVITIGVDVASFLAYATKAGLAPELIAFVQHLERQLVVDNKPTDTAIHQYPPQAGSDALAFLTPRAIFRCNAFMTMGLSDSELERNIAHNVGDDWARGFMNFLATYRLLPDLNAIIADPANAKIHREPSVNYALTTALVSRLTMQNIAAITTYIKRLDGLYQASFWSRAITKDGGVFADTAEHTNYLIWRSKQAA